MLVNLDRRTFVSAFNTDNGEVGSETVFQYRQEGNLVWAEYAGGAIVKGHLIANMDDAGVLDMRYHHVNDIGELMIGKCISTPEVLDDGRIKLHEKWQWLSGDMSSGTSEIIELKAD